VLKEIDDKLVQHSATTRFQRIIYHIWYIPELLHEFNIKMVMNQINVYWKNIDHRLLEQRKL